MRFWTQHNNFGFQDEEEFIQKMLSVFDEADLDGDGSIDFSEFIKNEWQVHLRTFTQLHDKQLNNKKNKQNEQNN